MADKEQPIVNGVGETADFEVGQRVLWRYVPRGGWNLVIPVCATVKKLNPKSVQIEVYTPSGTKLKRVKPTSLYINDGAWCAHGIMKSMTSSRLPQKAVQ